ncbi:abortive infection family protein [Streptomyces sundarbansensis]
MSVTPFLSQGSRAAVVDVAARLDSRDVRRAFTDEGFAFRPQALRAKSDAPTRAGRFFENLVTASEASNSRILVGHYLDEVDWSSAVQTLAALGAIEELLWLFDEAAAVDEYWDSRPGDRLRYKLEKEGFRFDRHGRIHPATKLLAHGALAGLSDPDLIRQVLRRITAALPDDPMLAIGSAKELVEGTSKAILAQLGKPIPSNAKVPELVHLAEEALGNHPKSVPGTPDGAPVIRRLLGKLTGMTDDLAALRNDYGTGHAPTTLPQGLQPRHGRLAVAAADAWCTFMLDTLAEQTGLTNLGRLSRGSRKSI